MPTPEAIALARRIRGHVDDAADEADALAIDRFAAQRGAAAAEARRAAIEECAQYVEAHYETGTCAIESRHLREPYDLMPIHNKYMAADLRALASPPAPQEETR